MNGYSGGSNHFTFIKSPDKKYLVKIYNFKANESSIKIYNNYSKRLLLDTSFISKDGEHGFGIIQAEWTSDSKYFVFGTFSSGGHQPWHVPTYIFSIQKKKFICIDKTNCQVCSPYKLFPPNSIEITGFTKTIKELKKFVFRLPDLFKQ